MQNIFASRYFLWVLLCLPALGMLSGVSQGSMTPHTVLHPSGEFSVRMMIVAMLASPLVTLFPKVRAFRWLLRRRRYFGVAAFGYALIHTYYYVIDSGSLSAIMGEALDLPIWTGWAAFLIFLPLALTSTDGAMRAMGARWKQLQRWVYAAAILSAAHWLFLEWHWAPMLVHFGPLLVLEGARYLKLRRGGLPVMA